MRIGPRDVGLPLVLSPMVDVTDAAFRSVAREAGADVTCCEMVSAAGIVHDNPTSWRLVQPWPGESPYGVQLMGGDPEQVADAVRRVVEQVAPDFVDLNLGCPSPNILRSEAGGFLLRDPKKAGQVIGAAVDAAGDTPVSVKMRTGPTDAKPTFIQVGEAAQAAGAQWCTLHGRSVEQGYQGHASWPSIGRLVDALDIPVIGNGDIRGPADVIRMRDETGCAGFFIARAAMHDPTVFGRLRAALDGRPAVEPGLSERLQALETYMQRAAEIGIADPGLLKRQATRFVSGTPGAKALRRRLHEARDVETVGAIIAAARRSLEVPS